MKQYIVNQTCAKNEKKWVWRKKSQKKLCVQTKEPCQILLLDRDKTKNKHYEQTLKYLVIYIWHTRANFKKFYCNALGQNQATNFSPKPET